QAAAGGGGVEAFLRGARRAGAEEEAIHLRVARLAQAADGRRHRPGDLARARPEKADPAAARRAVEERAGRAPVRAAGVYGAARGPLLLPPIPDRRAETAARCHHP